MNSQDPIIYKAASTLYIGPRVGHNCSLALNERVKMLLIKRLVEEFNRMFEDMLVVFFLLEDIDILYKTVERLYSDEQVGPYYSQPACTYIEEEGNKRIRCNWRRN